MASDKIQALENEVVEGKKAANMASDKIHALESQNQRQDEKMRGIQAQLAQNSYLQGTGRLKCAKSLDNQRFGWGFTSQQVYFKHYHLFYTQSTHIYFSNGGELSDYPTP